MRMSLIIKVQILFLNDHIGFPLFMRNLDKLTNFEHGSNLPSAYVLLVSILRSTLNHQPLKFRHLMMTIIQIRPCIW